MSILVECLRCGEPHRLHRSLRQLDESECPRCGYLGWTPRPEPSHTVPPALRSPASRRPGRRVLD